MKYSCYSKNHWLISWTLPLISWALPIIECFYRPGLSQGSGPVVLVSDQLFSSLFILSQLGAFSVACPSLPTALHLSRALIPRLLSILHTDWAWNPLHPISTGNSQILQPRLLHYSCNLVYFAIFRSYASSHLVSQGTVSSTIISFLWFGHHITMSGICAVWMMFGNTSCFPRSTFIYQQSDSSRIDVVGALLVSCLSDLP